MSYDGTNALLKRKRIGSSQAHAAKKPSGGQLGDSPQGEGSIIPVPRQPRRHPHFPLLVVKQAILQSASTAATGRGQQHPAATARLEVCLIHWVDGLPPSGTVPVPERYEVAEQGRVASVQEWKMPTEAATPKPLLDHLHKAARQSDDVQCLQVICFGHHTEPDAICRGPVSVVRRGTEGAAALQLGSLLNHFARSPYVQLLVDGCVSLPTHSIKRLAATLASLANSPASSSPPPSSSSAFSSSFSVPADDDAGSSPFQEEEEEERTPVSEADEASPRVLQRRERYSANSAQEHDDDDDAEREGRGGDNDMDIDFECDQYASFRLPGPQPRDRDFIVDDLAEGDVDENDERHVGDGVTGDIESFRGAREDPVTWSCPTIPILGEAS